MGNETLSALLFLNKQFKKIVHKGSRLEKLDQLEKPKDPKPNPALIQVFLNFFCLDLKKP